MFQALNVLEKYLNAMRIVIYDLDDTRQLWKTKKEGRLESGVKMLNNLIQPSAESQSASVVTITPSVDCHSGCVQLLPWEIVSLDSKEPQYCLLWPV